MGIRYNKYTPKILKVLKKYRSKEWLYQKYIIEKLPSRSIAKIVGADRKTIDQWLVKVGIKKRGFGGSERPTKEVLFNKYIKENKSLRNIAKEMMTDAKAVHYWLMQYDIPRRAVGEHRKGKDHPSWRGGKYASKRGYIWLYKPDHPNCNSRGYVPEHRFKTELVLKRYLKKEEVIHHINFKRNDNRLENLYLFSSQRDHARHHKLLELKKENSLISNLSTNSNN